MATTTSVLLDGCTGVALVVSGTVVLEGELVVLGGVVETGVVVVGGGELVVSGTVVVAGSGVTNVTLEVTTTGGLDGVMIVVVLVLTTTETGEVGLRLTCRRASASSCSALAGSAARRASAASWSDSREGMSCGEARKLCSAACKDPGSTMASCCRNCSSAVAGDLAGSNGWACGAARAVSGAAISPASRKAFTEGIVFVVLDLQSRVVGIVLRQLVSRDISQSRGDGVEHSRINASSLSTLLHHSKFSSLSPTEAKVMWLLLLTISLALFLRPLT